MDGFVAAAEGGGFGAIDGVVAVAGDSGAVAEGVGLRWAGVVVVSELHDDEVAGLEFVEGGGPELGGFEEGAGGGAAEGVVDDGDFFGVEVEGEDVSPAPLAVGAVVAAVFDGGVADDVEGGIFSGGGFGGRVGGVEDGGEEDEGGECREEFVHVASPARGSFPNKVCKR